jgi:tetratricopeptide (TPR) repeat protein
MIQPLFAQATTAHGAGDLARAEMLYRQILTLAPNHPDALHLLGRLACDRGQPAAGADLLARAVRLRPRIAEYMAGLAHAQLRMGQTEAGLESWRRAVRLKPEAASLQFGHGMALAEAGQIDPAVQAFRRAVAREPGLVAAHAAAGAALLQAGRAEEAEAAFANAVRLRPADADGYFNLGCAQMAQQKLEAAEASFRAALARRADHAGAWGNLGLTLQNTGQLAAAAACLERAAALQPGSAAAQANLGIVLRALSRFTAAEAAMRRAVALAPESAVMLCHLGNVLRDQGKLPEAEGVLRAAVARDPENREARIGLAFARLVAGRLPEGWPDFAWRGAAAPARARYARPRWDGGDLPGPLLVYAEQGAGDFIQFCRYVPLLAARGVAVALAVPPGLQRLAGSLAGVADPAPAPGACVAACADMDLPGLFGTAMDKIPAAVPYLHAPAASVARWHARLAALPGRKVGIAWAGNPAYFHDRQRSIPAGELGALAGLEGITFVSVQPDRHAGAPEALGLVDWTAELDDFAETAALIEALDLTLAVDSAVAHLAGALGRPVWLLNRYAPDWRWLLGRDDSPWYPTLRQFRQTEPGDWAGVLARVRDALLVG